MELLLLIPGLWGAWKTPSCWRWIKMKLTTAFATAIMAQLEPRLAVMQDTIDEVRHQVFPNSGGSAYDQITRVLESSRRTESHLNLLRGTMRAHQDADLSQARFEADAAGEFVWVSHAFLRWCNRGSEQVVGYGWVNAVAHADRERVRAEFEAAIEERREFTSRFTMHPLGGEDFQVDAFAKPIRCSASGAVEHWVGVITRV